ncbi:NAD(P)-dependent oxidoreductase [Psychroflexus tropicus]|uniref:NAD(P)-dependent oxidoreductase n=1 Tax=Psychroflexus tropicus TaxID=197345 RepID=UPI000380B000|nr:NAD(P)-dependent oxidoreductase [Psychroflexus tropicus]
MKILATDGFSEVGIQLLENAGHEVIIKNIAKNQISTYINANEIEGLLVKATTPLDRSLISELKTLKFIGNCDKNAEHISENAAKEQNIKVLNANDAWTNSIAELVIAHLLSCMRHLKDANREMPLEGDHKFKQLQKSFSGGLELKGKTLGIIGFGKIGQDVAKKAMALGMQIKFYDPEVDSLKLTLNFPDEQQVVFNLKGSSLEDVLSTCDAISLHISQSDSYVIGQEELQMMKPTAGIINTSYHKALDEVALVKQLENNELAFGALDVFEDQPQPPIQLMMYPKLSLTPNLSGATQETQDRIAEELSSQILSLY